jgi:enoyl-CoA hydratase/carnithine racemase
MTFREIRYDVEDGVCTVTLNRPDRLNAVTTTMLGELGEAWDRADADDAVRAVIVTGAGRAFCAGADLGAGGATFDYRRASAGGDSSDRSPRAWGPQPPGGPAARSAAPRRPAARTADAAARRRSASAEDHRDGGGIVTLRIFDMKKPVIAAINGPAVGFGITLTLPMDVRLASTAARIGFVFARRGVVPEACSTWFLPRLVGISQAAEWVYTGRVFSAEEALAGGLVSRIVAPDALLPAARQLALEIAQNTSAVSVTLARQMMWKLLGADHPAEAHRLDSLAMFWTGRSADAREGISAFHEKRPARFTLRPSADLPPFYPWWQPRPFRSSRD